MKGTAEATVPLRRLASCLDAKRVPISRVDRAAMPGDVPYWGSGGVLDTVATHLFDEPLVLLGEDGAPFFESGRDVAFLLDGPAWVNNHVHILRPNVGVDRRFLVYALNAVDYALYITGSTRDKLTQEDMWRIQIPYVPEARQRAIADYLDRETAGIDALATAKRRMVELLEEERTLVLVKQVAPQLLSSERAPEGWCTTRLKYLFYPPVAGAWGSEPQGGALDSLCIRVADFDRRRFRVDERVATWRSIEDGVRRKCQLKWGDVLIEKSGGGETQPVGFAVMFDLDVDAICSNFVARLRPRPELEPPYAGLILATAYRAECNVPYVKQTTGIQNLDLPAYLSLPWHVPDRRTQLAICEVLKSAFAVIDEATRMLERQLTLLQERRQALITAVVRGRLDSPEAA